MSLGSYIVFTKDDGNWWSRFLHKDIQHCFIAEPDKGLWIIYGKSRKSVDLYTVESYSDIIKESVILKAEKKQNARGLLMLNTCVGQVKQYLGIRNPFIVTPYQLYKRLKHEIT